ncbi:MAG TPA: helix-turn-helix transcriptional regulator [Candidatus Dormibacteraeota bacterium]|nr:helix-turn-helix transcriptional regulator [Candidatus Dormibacteraeota bacterium]
MSDGQDIRSALGSTLRSRRLGAGLSLAALAQKADLSAAHISDVERGVKDLSSDRLARACAALALQPAELFGDMSAALGDPQPALDAPAPGMRLVRSAEMLSPQALRTVAEFSAYLASKEHNTRRRRKIGFEF